MKIKTPLTDEKIKDLKAGDKVYLSGYIYTARDQAHKKLYKLIKNNEELPIDLNNSVLYYTGPAPAPPDQTIGACGPTTSYRMDEYTPALLQRGLKGIIGKGPRSKRVVESLKEHKALYFAAIGGTAALLSKKIIEAKVIAYPELETEAIRLLKLKEFPLVVINDIYGNDYYEIGQNKFKETR
ncbi:MAG: Fe-S-containing hydro-lyase [Halanaerobiales bacterium]|nr:Fe-S-containing hydro-lyase [Halanaerobiales bacterium]